MIKIVIIIIKIKNIICNTFTIPRSLVFLKISRSWPDILDRPEVEPEEDNNSPIIIQTNAIIKIITAIDTFAPLI